MADGCLSRPLHGPGSAVARLFGTSATQLPGVCPLAVDVGGTSSGTRGRRSLHHSWVRPGRTVFTDAETASKMLMSAVTSRAAAAAAIITGDASDVSDASDHC